MNIIFFNFLNESVRFMPICLVAGSVHNHCGIPGSMKINSEVGYISSHVTQTNGIGNNDCPWTVQVGQGQTIQLTLLDFSSLTTDDTSCYQYATIRERSVGAITTVCSTSERLSSIYTSVSNQLEIRLMSSTGEHRPFMIKYQGSYM